MADGAQAEVVGLEEGGASIPLTDAQRRAASLLAVALALGIATQGLFWNARLGINFCLWDGLLAGALLVAWRRAGIASAAWGCATASALFGFAAALHASAWSMTIAVPCAGVTLLVLPLLLAEKARLWQIPRLAARALGSFEYFGRIPAAVTFTVKLPFGLLGSSQKTRSLRVLVGLVLGTLAASVFIALFSSDPEFAWWMGRAFDRAHSMAWFGFLSLSTAVGYLFVHSLHDGALHDRAAAPLAPAIPETPESPEAAIALDRPDASGDASLYRDWHDWRTAVVAPAAPPPLAKVRGAYLSRETWGTLLVPVIFVFGVFVVLSLRHVFRGDAYVRNASGPSYSAYLHAGFYELLVATILSVCLVLSGHWLLRERGNSDLHARVPGGNGIRALEVSLLGLTILTLFSCVERLAMYEEAYGATYLRLGVAVIALAVLGVLGLCIAKSVLRRWRSFGGALVVWFTGVALAASAFDADAYIACRNLDRAAAGKPLDVDYLVDLSADAQVALRHAYLANASGPPLIALRARLQRAWTPPPKRDWRETRW
ncbi:MAG TPA: DUF4173 domain-containing protein [Polyangiaceae bacterium]|nr:DUF4173 domain-containing protein [Polyangiaceae bacterium]